LYSEQRADFRRVNINDLMIDEDTMVEVATIEVAELPDVPNLSSMQLTTVLPPPEPDSTGDEDKP
jgi:hypothetical protein